MSFKLNTQLADELGLLHFLSKDQSHTPEQSTQNVVETMPQPQIDKNEFRLLAKMLDAIQHKMDSSLLSIKNGVTLYDHPNKQLIFDDVNKSDTDQAMHLAPLSAMIQQPQLKRPVWEKLKTLSA